MVQHLNPARTLPVYPLDIELSFRVGRVLSNHFAYHLATPFELPCETSRTVNRVTNRYRKKEGEMKIEIVGK